MWLGQPGELVGGRVGEDVGHSGKRQNRCVRGEVDRSQTTQALLALPATVGALSLSCNQRERVKSREQGLACTHSHMYCRLQVGCVCRALGACQTGQPEGHGVVEKGGQELADQDVMVLVVKKGSLTPEAEITWLGSHTSKFKPCVVVFQSTCAES